MNNLTHDSIISTLADSGKPMASRAVAKALGVEHVGVVTSMLMDLVRDETLKRTTGGAYQLRDAGVHDTPVRSASLRREILQTDKVAIEASKRKSARGRIVDRVKPHDVVVEVMTLEKAEQAVDEEKARDQRIRDAVDRLKAKSSREIKPVSQLELKIEILDGIGLSDEDLWDVLHDVINDLQRLEELAQGPF